MLDTAFMPGKTCERCYLEFLIVDGVPVTREQYEQQLLTNR